MAGAPLTNFDIVATTPFTSLFFLFAVALNDGSQFHHLRTLLASIWSSFTSSSSLFSAMAFLYVAWANATDMPKGIDELRLQFVERQSYSPKVD
jgi:hypothetical protein